MSFEVSVIIAAYNEEDCIRECLESLRVQTHTSFEIVFVDDGSTDRTARIASEYRVRLILSEHIGPARARNLAVNNASGEILVFVDADMSFHEEFIEKLIDPIKRDGVAGTFTKEEYVRNWDNPWARCWTINCGLPDRKRHAADFPDTDQVFRAIRRDDFLSVGGYDNVGYAEDHSLSRKLGRLAVNAPGAICYHCNPDSLKDVYLSARWYGRGEQMGRGLGEVLRHTLPFSIRNGLARALARRNSLYPIFLMVYDTGLLVGMVQRATHPERHMK